MAKTLADIQSEVRTYLDEATQADFLDAEITRSINHAYHEVASSVMDIYQEFYATLTPFTYAVVSGKQEYLIDPSLIRVERVEINYNPILANSVSSRAMPVKMDEIRGNLANTNTTGSFVSPIYYLHGDIGAQQIGFLPVPTISDTTGKSISVWGVSIPADLVNTTDNVNIPYADRFTYLISLKAAAQMLRKGQQEEQNATNYMQEYDTGLQKMENFLKNRLSDDGDYIVDNASEDIDFQTTGI
jgi:hypothetical protein